MFLFPHFVAFEISGVQVFVSFLFVSHLNSLNILFSSCSVASSALITIAVQVHQAYQLRIELYLW